MPRRQPTMPLRGAPRWRKSATQPAAASVAVAKAATVVDRVALPAGARADRDARRDQIEIRSDRDQIEIRSQQDPAVWLGGAAAALRPRTAAAD